MNNINYMKTDTELLNSISQKTDFLRQLTESEAAALKKTLLGMHNYIIKVCDNNKLSVMLGGGSCLGAVRHKGFIPWDDDFDIIMDYHNYSKFLIIAKEKLDSTKYYVEEGFVDSPNPFSKIRLLGTHFEESNKDANSEKCNGIFIDIFNLENAPNGKIARLWQYVCSKLLLTICLKDRGFESDSPIKKLSLFLSTPLNNKQIKNYFRRQVEKYRGVKTDYLGSFGGNLRYKNIFFKRTDFSNPIRVPFEDLMLPLPSGYDSILTQIYGDYMTPPPNEKQICSHHLKIEFGNY